MKFSLINGQRQEAQPGRSGECPACNQAMVAKCGEVKIWHWAHKGRRTCDPWWENETEWHRDWKGRFPESWQEIVQFAKDGEKHIADVKTDQGWVIEFQHSYIKPDERRSRDAFYAKLAWVVDGTRRKRDKAQFFDALKRGKAIDPNSWVVNNFLGECVLLQEWVASHAPVFLDFGDEKELWFVQQRGSNGLAFVKSVSRSNFIETHRGAGTDNARDFDAFVNGLGQPVSQSEPRPKVPAPQLVQPQTAQDSRRELLLRQYRPRQRRL